VIVAPLHRVRTVQARINLSPDQRRRTALVERLACARFDVTSAGPIPKGSAPWTGAGCGTNEVMAILLRFERHGPISYFRRLPSARIAWRLAKSSLLPSPARESW
jgi:hypothetical protein